MRVTPESSYLAAGGQQGLIVVGQLHETCTETVPDFDKADIILNRRGVLEPKKIAVRPSVLARRTSSPVRPWKISSKPLKPAVPGLNIGNRFTKRLVIGDCYMHCGDAAFLHLPEYLLRPIGILKIVDQMHGLSRYRMFVPASISVYEGVPELM